MDFLSHIPLTTDYHTSLLLVMEGRARFKNYKLEFQQYHSNIC